TGLWVIAASARQDFAREGNGLLAANVVLGDLVLLTRPDRGGAEVTAVSGGTGAPVAGTEIWLYRYDWQKGHRRVETRTTGADGAVRFESGWDRQGAQIL